MGHDLFWIIPILESHLPHKSKCLNGSSPMADHGEGVAGTEDQYQYSDSRGLGWPLRWHCIKPIMNFVIVNQFGLGYDSV